MEYIIIPVILIALSFLAGMMGLGVAFILTPVLGLFGFDLKHVIMPWSLWLNGLAAIRGYAQLKLVSRKYPSMQRDQIDIVINNQNFVRPHRALSVELPKSTAMVENGNNAHPQWPPGSLTIFGA